MKKSSVLIGISFAAISLNVQPYSVNASTLSKPRPKTLRRIAKNLSLAVAIENIYLHPKFSSSEQILLKSIPSFISNRFTQKTIIQLRDGSRLTIEQTIQALKTLEQTLLLFSQEPSLPDIQQFEKALKSVQQLIQHLEKIV